MVRRTVGSFTLVSAVLAVGCAKGAPAPPMTRVELERTPCFGACPAYRVSLTSEGLVRFTGLHTDSGRVDSARVSPDAVRALAARFEAAGFFGMDSAYTPGEPGCGIWATDQPDAILCVALGDRRKTVRHSYGCLGPGVSPGALPAPGARVGMLGILERLAADVDSVAGTSRWTGR